MKQLILISGVLALGLVSGFGVGRLMPRHHYVHYDETRFLLDTDAGEICNPTGHWGWLRYDGGMSVPPCGKLRPSPNKVAATQAIDLSAGLVSNGATQNGVTLDFSKAQPIDLSAGIGPSTTHTASVNDIQSVHPCPNLIDQGLSQAAKK